MNVEDGRGGLFFATRDLERDFVAGDLERDRAGDLPASVGIVRDNLRRDLVPSRASCAARGVRPALFGAVASILKLIHVLVLGHELHGKA